MFGYSFNKQLSKPALFHGLLHPVSNEHSVNKYTLPAYPENYPVTSFGPLPAPDRKALPKVQKKPSPESSEHASARLRRRESVKATMLRDWNAYHERAWGKAELAPVAGVPKDTYGGWAATIVDSLDTLLIMDLKAEYEEAVEFALQIDFKAMPEGVVSSFEATIRYLGGFLSA